MEAPKVLYQIQSEAGKQWMPSNGTEGEMFMSAFCERCIHEKWMHTMNNADKKCDVLNRALLNAPDKQPEWIYSEEGWPICTEWKFWDWGSSDDEDGLNEPPEPPIDDPNQLCFPFILDEIEGAKINEKALAV